MGYFGETLRGVSWIGGLRVTTRTIAFIKIAILARLLLPEQFGFVGIALLAVSFFEATTETGIN
ncbi:MAG: Membrane protein involved in the export of O-antigen and teichoic acid, partial [Candidatus Woesebacteria bacterium GW2011_GWB1_44_11b]